MSATAPAGWTESRERGNTVALRLMAWIATHLGRRVARWLLPPVTIYYVLFSPTARRHSRRYLDRVLGRPAGWRDGYRHVFAFASTVLDRVWFVQNRVHEFNLRPHGVPVIEATLQQGRGAFMLGAHLGSFEALHAIGGSLPGLRVAMVMYPDNAQKIHGVLQAIAPDFHMSIIPIGRPGATLAIREWLDSGGLAGLLGDRFLPEAGARSGEGSVMVPFLGVPAPFSDGPLRLAMLLKRPVIFMVGLYRGGNTYDIHFEKLADFTQPPADAAGRDAAVREALHAYVARLEQLCREHPYNWFNFHDFWNEDAA